MNGPWADTWQLPISVNKCCILHIGNKTLCRPLCINVNVLPAVKTCRCRLSAVTICSGYFAAHRLLGVARIFSGVHFFLQKVDNLV